MPGLKKSLSNRPLRRRSALDLLHLSASSEHDDIPHRGTVSSDFPATERPHNTSDRDFSDSVRMASEFTDMGDQEAGDGEAPSRKSQDSIWHPRNFNFYKWRHAASESQLSAKARAQQQSENVPPVPALPHERE
jgi:hypothetical protein